MWSTPHDFSALRKLSPSPIDGDFRLTDSVHELIRSGLRVESYRLYDQDEVQGINSGCRIWQQAEFIIRNACSVPADRKNRTYVAFGTGGWRAIIGEGFTLHNVRRLCQALANEITRQGMEKRGVIIGYDRRFLSKQAGEASAEVFAGNNIPAILLTEDAPTPLITYATAIQGSAYGLAFTASHNPPEWNGLKVFHGDGSLLLDNETRQIEAETNALTTDDVIKLELDIAHRSRHRPAARLHQCLRGRRRGADRHERHPQRRSQGHRRPHVRGRPAHARHRAHRGALPRDVHSRAPQSALRRTVSRAEPGSAAPAQLRRCEEANYDLGLAMDGDADRVAIVDERGEYISINDILLLLYWYLHEIRGEKGGVVRNLSTSHLLDRLAHKLGEECYETPVGFKHIASACWSTMHCWAESRPGV